MSTRRIARRLRVPHTREWRTLHAEGMYPYHVQRVQHLRPDEFAERLEFCKWLNGILFYVFIYLFTYRVSVRHSHEIGSRQNHVLSQNRFLKKGKSVPLQARSGPEGSKKLRFPDFVTMAQDGGRLSALRTGRLYP